MSPSTVMSEKSILNLLSRVAILHKRSKEKSLGIILETSLKRFAVQEAVIDKTALSHPEGQGKLL